MLKNTVDKLDRLAFDHQICGNGNRIYSAGLKFRQRCSSLRHRPVVMNCHAKSGSRKRMCDNVPNAVPAGSSYQRNLAFSHAKSLGNCTVEACKMAHFVISWSFVPNACNAISQIQPQEGHNNGPKDIESDGVTSSCRIRWSCGSQCRRTI